MVRSYNIKSGLVFATLIGFLAAVLPRLIRFDMTTPRAVVVNFINLFITVFLYWMIHNLVMNTLTRGWSSNPIIKPVIAICCSVGVIVLIAWGLSINNIVPVKREDGTLLSEQQSRFIRLFRSLVVSALTYFVVYYYRTQLALQQSRFENEYLKHENLQAQLTSLKQQISPHFLFNSLNTLSSLSKEEAVKEYVLNLSEVYRYVLRYQERKEVSVKDELVFIHSYIYILKSRFEESIIINIQVSADNMYQKILPFSLQLLVENSIKHNAVSYNQPLAIHIYDKDGRLVVENDLRPRTTMEASSGTGLYNLSKRYRLTAGKEIVISKSDTCFKVEIPFL